MKVSIITEGFQNTGYGHVTRCLSLYQAFELRNIVPTLYVNGDETCTALLKDTRHEIINWLDNHDLIFSKIHDSDVVIVDSYLADKPFYDRVSLVTPFPVYVDDNNRLQYPSGIVVNGNVYAEDLDYDQRGDKSYLLGTRYALLRKEFWEIVDRPIRIDIQNILITFGGSDLENVTPRIMRFISRNFPNLKKRVIIGEGFKNTVQIEQSKDGNTDLFFAPKTFDILKLMYESDLAICSGGQTINELARTGVPTIAISVAENQNNNVKGWVKEKFLVSELTFMQPNLENRMLLIFNHLKKKQTREAISKLGKYRVDGSGPKRVVQHLIDKLCGKSGFYFRKAGDKDSTLIFTLSNDRLVRANSINQDVIKWATHLDWFSGKLLDDDCYFLLAFNNTDNFIGQIRFDVKGYYAEINISLEKAFRGKGFSKNLIFNSSYKCFREKRNVGYILAYIRPINTPSIKAFTKAGYHFFQKEVVKGEELLVYKLSR